MQNEKPESEYTNKELCDICAVDNGWAAGELERRLEAAGVKDSLTAHTRPPAVIREARFKPHPSKPDTIIGHWLEDFSEYEIVVPYQLRPYLLAWLKHGQ